ncbi:MAG: hypothetical protein ACYDCI_00140 [Candidatus Limnocylindrales bacterium]
MALAKWVYAGVPHYLDKQTARLGIPQVDGHRARNNDEINKLAVLLAQLTERHRAAYRGPDGLPVFYELQLREVRAIAEQAERYLRQLHIVAAGSEAMLAEMYAAFGLTAPRRIFEVLCDLDPPASGHAAPPTSAAAEPVVDEPPTDEDANNKPEAA